MVLSISLVESVSSLETLSELEEEEESSLASSVVTLTSEAAAAAFAALALVFLTGSLSSCCGVSRSSLPAECSLSVSTILRSHSDDSEDSLA